MRLYGSSNHHSLGGYLKDDCESRGRIESISEGGNRLGPVHAYHPESQVQIARGHWNPGHAPPVSRMSYLISGSVNTP